MNVAPTVLLAGRAAAEQHAPRDGSVLYCVCGQLRTTTHIADVVTIAVLTAAGMPA